MTTQSLSPFVSVTECAARHNVTRAAVHAAIKAGRLEAVRIGNAYAIPRESAEAYQPLKDYAAMGRRSGAARRQRRREGEETR